MRTSAAAASALAGVGLYTWRVEPHWVEVVQRTLPISHLPVGLAGATLMHLSDIHVGPRVDDAFVADTFRRLSVLRPDIVVITGDLISHSESVFDQAAAVYRHVPRGRLSTIAVLGNHDYGPDWAQPAIAGRVVETVRPFGVDVLRNEVRTIGGLQVVGLDDWWAHAFNPAAAFQQLDASRAAIVLSHNPDTIDLPGWNGYRGWILSGHTHGGQCKPPFLPPPLLPVRNKRYTSGEIGIADGRRVYISRGLGHLLRVRFNVRPEVTIHTLVSG